MKAIIMAGGKGTRLTDDEIPLPKVLRNANGRPLLSYVLDSVDFIYSDDIIIVVGYMAEKVEAAFPDNSFIKQGDSGYGTGYAVMCGLEHPSFDDYDGEIAVLSGDVPLIKKETIRAMQNLHREKGYSCTLLSCVTDKKLPFGRIIRKQGEVTAIKEEKECTDEEKQIKELNVGFYIFDAIKLKKALLHVTENRVTNEYYLTDVPRIMLAAGEIVEAYATDDEDELWGVNTLEDLIEVEKILIKKSTR